MGKLNGSEMVIYDSFGFIPNLALKRISSGNNPQLHAQTLKCAFLGKYLISHKVGGTIE